MYGNTVLKNSKKVSENICRFAKESNRTQKELAHLLDISPRQMRRYMSGEVVNINSNFLLRLSAVLYVPVDALLEGALPAESFLEDADV